MFLHGDRDEVMLIVTRGLLLVVRQNVLRVSFISMFQVFWDLGSASVCKGRTYIRNNGQVNRKRFQLSDSGMFYDFVWNIHVHLQYVERWSRTDCPSSNLQVAGNITDMRSRTIFCLLCRAMQVLLPSVEKPSLECRSRDCDCTRPEPVDVCKKLLHVRMVFWSTYCLATSPPIHSPSGRALSGLRRASMIMATWLHTSAASDLSECSSNMKKRFMRSHALRSWSAIASQFGPSC